MTDLMRHTPAKFASFLREHGIGRAFLVWDDAGSFVRASHAALAPLAGALADLSDFDRHEGVFIQLGPETRSLQAAFVHCTCRGQAAGGVRHWSYETIGGFLRDGLRLAKGMTQKNALAGLWWGGGKGVIARGTAAPAAPRHAVYEDYGRLVSSIRGCYVTAEDAGTTPLDMAAVFRTTRFTSCIPAELGGSGNPSEPTARGIVRGMEAALAHRGAGTLQGKTVVIQGLGHVGGFLLGFLRERGVARVVGADLDAEHVERARAQASACGLSLDASVVGPDDFAVFASEADVLAPCATGGMLNPETIPRIGAPIVCGAANNQLQDPERDGELLRARGITYVPDFLVNRMGIVTCADEQYGRLPADPAIERHLGDDEDGIFRLTRRVLGDADRRGVSPDRIARELADRAALQPHPVWGHRGKRLIEAVVASDWADTA